MATVAKKYQDELPRIKKNVQHAWEYFRPNYDSFNKWQKFIFITSMDEKERALLKELGKPDIEFNILEAYVSRLCGEFSKQEPSIEVSAGYGDQVDPNLIHIVEGHFRHLECDARKSGTASDIYKDQASGGFCVAKIWTEYENEKSMDQVIKWGRVFDPCLCFFDPLAREAHKADSRWWGDIFPKTKEEFEQENPDIDISGLKFSRNVEGFNWSYNNERDDVLLICDYYEKKTKKTKIVQLSDQRRTVMTADEYKEFQQRWIDTRQIGQIPTIIKERMTDLPVICRYRFIENQVIEYSVTVFKQPNLVFFDGNSAFIRETSNSALQQRCRPYPYQAAGAQKLKNFAGQTFANELENITQSKFIAAKEAIAEGYEDAYTNVQKASMIVYNAFKDDDPNVPLPPPQAVPRPPAPPEIMNGFMMADQLTQSILGSYDASLGINNNQLSGAAIEMGAIQSNAAAMPYVIKYIQSLNQVAQVILDLIPKYYVTPRTIPVVDKEGKRTFVPINQQGGVSLDYDSNALNVKVEAGANFAIQKNKALSQLVSLAQSMPIFGEFLNTVGLVQVVDNLEIRGSDELKLLAKQFMAQKQQQQKQAQQMAQQQAQNNPIMIKAQNERMKIMQDGQQNQMANQLKVAELSLQQTAEETDRMKVLADMQANERDGIIELDKHQTEKTRAAVDLAIHAADVNHAQIHKTVQLAHNMNMDHLRHEAMESQAQEAQEHAT
jgi:hypothetical protein